jgi:hypothetical protein
VGTGSVVLAGQKVILQNSTGIIGTVAISSNGANIILNDLWAGPTGTGILYTTTEAIPEDVADYYVRCDALGTLAQRSTYDAQADGFVYLQTDGTPTYWIRTSSISGVWFNAATNVVIWVATTGDDTNDGSFDNPLLTIQAAVNLISSAAFDATGMVVTVVLRAGTYNSAVVLKDVKGALSGLIICGETALGGTLNSSAVITRSLVTGDAAIMAINLKSSWTLVGFTVGGPLHKGHGLMAKAARLRFNQLNFARVTGAHIASLANGNIALADIPGNNGYDIGDIANAHWLVNGSGATIDIQAETTSKPAIRCNGALPFATAFAWARASGQIFTGTGINFVNKTNVTGRRWRAEQNCSIDSGQSGEKYLPGTLAGVAVKNGEYL